MNKSQINRIWDKYKQDIAGYTIALTCAVSPIILTSTMNQLVYGHLSAPSKQEISTKLYEAYQKGYNVKPSDWQGHPNILEKAIDKWILETEGGK